MNQVQDVNGVKLLAVEVKDGDMNGLRNLGDQLKEKLGDGVVLIASTLDGKVSLMASVTDGAMKKGTCWKLNQSNRRSCRRRRWHTSEHGTGWRKESVWHCSSP